METEFGNLLKALGGDAGWVTQALTVMAAWRLIAKFLNAWVQARLTQALTVIAKSPEVDDDALVKRILSSKGYRGTAFVIDLLLSVKLPTHAQFQELLAQPPNK